MSLRKTFEGVEREFSGEKIVYRESQLSGDFGGEIRESKKKRSRLGEITLFNANMVWIGDTSEGINLISK